MPPKTIKETNGGIANGIINGIIKSLLLFALVFPVLSYSQTRTVGLFLNDTTLSYKGYTLLAPNKYTSTYLINNQGRLVHKWSSSAYSPGNAVYLLPNGNLLRTCKIQGYVVGGEGGRVEMFSWGDTLLWQFTYNTANYITHHDVKYLPNGNILMIACEKKTISQLLAAGFDSSKFQPDVIANGYMLPDYVIEVQPTFPVGGNIVWEWHVWDHLIQDYDSTKLNYGVVANHPELADCDGDGQKAKTLWNHMNSINYNSKFDQIILSVRSNSEIWIIDHSTTTQQAAGHTGGRYGKGGDLLYRWGNPVCYKMGTAANQKLFQQHDAEWIDTLCPGEGNISVFNNGLGRNYSSADEFAPPVDSLGFYYRAPNTAFGPSGAAWSYTATPPASFFSQSISGVQRLINGNTLITGGVNGTVFEVTPAGQVVWKYVNPVINTGPLHYNDSVPIDPNGSYTYSNLVFKYHRYSPSYPAFIGKDLTPGNFIELYYTGIENESGITPATYSLNRNYPNPFNPYTTISFQIPRTDKVTLRIFDVSGKEIETLVNQELTSGKYKVTWNAERYSSGIYFCNMSAGKYFGAIKLMLVK